MYCNLVFDIKKKSEKKHVPKIGKKNTGCSGVHVIESPDIRQKFNFHAPRVMFSFQPSMKAVRETYIEFTPRIERKT